MTWHRRSTAHFEYFAIAIAIPIGAAALSACEGGVTTVGDAGPNVEVIQTRVLGGEEAVASALGTFEDMIDVEGHGFTIATPSGVTRATDLVATLKKTTLQALASTSTPAQSQLAAGNNACEIEGYSYIYSSRIPPASGTVQFNAFTIAANHYLPDCSFSWFSWTGGDTQMSLTSPNGGTMIYSNQASFHSYSFAAEYAHDITMGGNAVEGNMETVHTSSETYYPEYSVFYSSSI